MPRFLFQVRNAQGELTSGVLAAPSLEAAGQILRQQGQFIIRIRQVPDEEPLATDTPLHRHARRVHRHDVLFFVQQMAVMIDTGVPIVDALECLAEQAANPHFRPLLQDIGDYVQAGGTLSRALERYPNVFPPIMVALIRAGELSGTLAPMLQHLSLYLEKEDHTRYQVRSALAYPLIMAVTAVLVTVLLLSFVLPRFATLYAARRAVLPAPTRLLLDLSQSLTAHWPLWLATLALLASAFFLFLHSHAGRQTVDYLKLHLPLLRYLYRHLYLTRACRALATMLSAGLNVLEALDLVRQVTPNFYYLRLWDQVEETLKTGLQLSDGLARNPLVPRTAIQIIRSGEKSGRLAQALGSLSKYTEQEFDRAVQQLTRTLEPAMVLFMGAVIGFVAICLLLPIFNASRVVAG